MHFIDNPVYLLEAYADSGEGLDRAGGFAIQVCLLPHISDHQRLLLKCCFVKCQGLGGMLIRKVDGDYNNVVGFPAPSFFKFLDLLVEDEDDFLDI